MARRGVYRIRTCTNPDCRKQFIAFVNTACTACGWKVK